MTSTSAGRYRNPPRPSVVGSLLYLLPNLPLGVAGFAVVSVLTTFGIGTVIVWIGVPVLAMLVAGARGAASLERLRVHALLGTFVATPYRPLPGDGQAARWRTRLWDGATWRDITYFVLLLPIGIAEFVILIACWSVGLALLTLPVYFRYLPGGAYFFPEETHAWVIVDSTLKALPWALVGLVLTALSVLITRMMGAGHARFARLLLGQGRRAGSLREDRADGPVPATNALA
ncbi:sensor domain-containing protein [Amycolatopsis cynarae]|uniref:Sensor domain-containing protein n=1 Tax=Amycolatopsis cynarae TaxID=2995223 RepID=A0ABY7AZ48_9PSEU|nr:sensor domain-containing protein [Amycolatopsis sp. HUAS 11-8]WAL64743.1 sensor domain-containing protein [Amycolatopsis sp. HUAS 11-8]